MKWWNWCLIGLFLLVAFGGARVVSSRGYRNNNPGNVRPLPAGKKWQGQVGVDHAGSVEGYVIFDKMENGVRAMTRDLKVKIGRGLNTIEKILPVYAPEEDNNDVEAYIKSVSSKSGVAADKVISASDLPKIITAMMRHELGAEAFALVKTSDIQKGVSIA